MNLLSGLNPAQFELIAGALSFLFTIGLISYIIGDNPLYRVTLHLFIGVSIGYVTLVVIYQVLIPRVVIPLLSSDLLSATLAIVPFVLFGFLIFKLNPSLSPLGNIAIAYLIGVGAAVSIGGALTGTLLPQVQASWLSLSPSVGLQAVSNLIIIVGTVATLLYFQYWFHQQDQFGESQRRAPLRYISTLGQGIVVFTLGMVYGGLILSGIAVFASHLNTLSVWATQIFS